MMERIDENLTWKVSSKTCCLCKACENICPSDAIHFSSKQDTFLYPVIDRQKCIGCGLCEKACPVLSLLIKQDPFERLAWVARSRDEEIRRNSTSGGIFFELAKRIINNGGYVCGAIFDEDFHVFHVLTNDIEIVKQMRGSKYAQSNTTGIFRKILVKLDRGVEVLFCGCPCQTKALKLYLRKDYEKLYTIDFVCHGIPSDNALQEYLSILEKRNSSLVKSIVFRDKTRGWHSSSVKVLFENGKVYSEPITVDPYMRAMLSGTMMKASCFCCDYKNGQTGSDITLGDFWGAEVLFPQMDDNKGLSAVITNSVKGKELLRDLDVELLETDIKNVIKYNSNLEKPTRKSEKNEEFLRYAEEHGIGEAIFYFFEESKTEKIYRRIRYFIRCIYYAMRGRKKPIY